MSKSYSDLAARIRVPSGFLLGAIYIVFAHPTPPKLLWGSAVGLVGILLRAAAAGHLAKNQKLAAGGPYAYTRHPLYLGSALAGLGFCVAGGRWWFFLILGVFLAAVYVPVIRREEIHLSRLFPEEFGSNAGPASFLLPRRLAGPAAPESFRWELYWKNREYQAFLAYIAIVLILLSKMLLIMMRS